MDSLYSLERWICEVKEDCDDMNICLNVCIIGQGNEAYDGVYDEIGEDELFFVVEDEDLFCFDKRYLNDIVDIIEGADICCNLYVDVP